MSARGTSKGLLEVFKFACYVSIPVALMLTFGSNPENLEWIIRNRAYVVYPPEGPRPPSAEEIHELARKNRAVGSGPQATSGQ
eukprot:SM000369S13623  [mRNA]  locus=s369:29409:29766:+ [translate_table: standard]